MFFVKDSNTGKKVPGKDLKIDQPATHRYHLHFKKKIGRKINKTVAEDQQMLEMIKNEIVNLKEKSAFWMWHRKRRTTSSRR